MTTEELKQFADLSDEVNKLKAKIIKIKSELSASSLFAENEADESQPSCLGADQTDANTVLAAGQVVWLDKDLANHSKVEVVEQTPMRLFTVVRSLDSGYTWNVMSYRLTPACS